MSKFDDIERARLRRLPQQIAAKQEKVNRLVREFNSPTPRQLEREANRLLNPDRGRVPRAVAMRLSDILDGEKREGQVTHYAHYCPLPGRPLPPVEALEIPAALRSSYANLVDDL